MPTPAKPTGKRIIMRIEISPTSKKKVEDYCARAGMTQVAMMSRLVEFFETVPEMAQGAVMGHVDKAVMPDLIKSILEHLGKK